MPKRKRTPTIPPPSRGALSLAASQCAARQRQPITVVQVPSTTLGQLSAARAVESRAQVARDQLVAAMRDALGIGIDQNHAVMQSLRAAHESARVALEAARRTVAYLESVA